MDSEGKDLVSVQGWATRSREERKKKGERFSERIHVHKIQYNPTSLHPVADRGHFFT